MTDNPQSWHSWITKKVEALMGAHRQDPAAYWHGLRELARPFLTNDRQHLRFWRDGPHPFDPSGPLMKPDALWLREMLDTSERIIREHPPAAPLKPWLRVLREAETQSYAPIGDALEQAVRFVDSLPPSTAERWMAKTDAAREAGIDLERLRPWCTRDNNPLPTRWEGGREVVNLTDVLRERDVQDRRRSAKEPHASGTRSDTLGHAENARGRRGKRKR